jgi:hypothetical protein
MLLLLFVVFAAGVVVDVGVRRRRGRWQRRIGAAPLHVYQRHGDSGSGQRTRGVLLRRKPAAQHTTPLMKPSPVEPKPTPRTRVCRGQSSTRRPQFTVLPKPRHNFAQAEQRPRRASLFSLPFCMCMRLLACAFGAVRCACQAVRLCR